MHILLAAAAAAQGALRPGCPCTHLSWQACGNCSNSVPHPRMKTASKGFRVSKISTLVCVQHAVCYSNAALLNKKSTCTQE